MGATVVPATSKPAAQQGAAALRTFDGLDAVARFRAEAGGWHIFVRGQAR